MRIAISIVVWLAVLFSGGCAVFEKEMTNRGGYLDAVLDDHWMKADSKGMRALRAFAMQVSLARIATVSAKNDSDRQLLAIRIGALTKRFSPIYDCAFDTNPLGVAGAQNDPCFYYDSAMVDYSTGLFDLAMIALPLDDAKRLLAAVTGSAVNPINVADLLGSLLQIGKDALKYGRVVGALYRDTIELEVQLWLGTPAIDNRPPPFRVTEVDVAALREIYSRRNDDMPAWIAAMAALRGQGLEPLPQPKFFAELGGLMKYLCGLITKDSSALATCKKGLPTTVPPAASVLGGTAQVGLGGGTTAGGGGGGTVSGGTATKPSSSSQKSSSQQQQPSSQQQQPSGPGEQVPGQPPTGPKTVSATRLTPFEESLTTKDITEFQQKALCFSPPLPPAELGDLGPLGSATRLAIQSALKVDNQLLTDRKGILLRERIKKGVTCS
jgi:hypothetical protein